MQQMEDIIDRLLDKRIGMLGSLASLNPTPGPSSPMAKEMEREEMLVDVGTKRTEYRFPVQLSPPPLIDKKKKKKKKRKVKVIVPPKMEERRKRRKVPTTAAIA